LVSAALEPVAPSLCGQLAWVEGLLAAYTATVARLVSALPFARVGTEALVTAACVGVLAGVGLRWLTRSQRHVPAAEP
jgi:hypothetical protein